MFCHVTIDQIPEIHELHDLYLDILRFLLERKERTPSRNLTS